MEIAGKYIMAIIETGGYFAPLLFICFHLVRPMLFIPVIFICVSGGVLFGSVTGSVYSLIGLTLSSMFFYGMVKWNPKMFQKLTEVKSNIFGERATITASQISILRLIPFLHYFLLSFCLIESTSNFKEYTKASFFTNIPFTIVYTSIGHWITSLSPLYMMILLFAFIPLTYLLRKKVEYIKWDEFFQVGT